MAFCLGATLLAGCSENAWNNHLDGYEEPTVYGVKETILYTLNAADYEAIASNTSNKAIAEENGESDALKAIGTNCCFTSEEQARLYIPAFLANSNFPYFTLNNGSSIKVTYDLAGNQPEAVLAINRGVKNYTVSAEDYQIAWGSDDDFIEAFAPVTPASASIPGFLAAAYPDAESGDYAVVAYKESSVNPVFGNAEAAPQTYIEEAFNENQGNFTTENVLLPEGSTYIWSFDSRNGGYMKASGYVGGKNCNSEGWLVSPEVKLSASANALLTFDQAWNYFASLEVAATEATVAVREKGGAWKTLSVPQTPQKFGWDFIASGDIDLSAYNGKTIQIGFCYKSTEDKAGTWEVKNVRLADGAATRALRAPASEVASVGKNAIYMFNGNSWTVPGSMVVLQPADYLAMGQTYGNLSGTQPEQFLPTYLRSALPYAADDAAEIVAYKYYNGSSTAYRASQYTLTAGEWVLNNGATTDQFTRKDGVFSYNPSVELTLPYARNTDPSYTYYMACVQWVFENVSKKMDPSAALAGGDKNKPVPAFIDYRDNAEFYSGASAYYGNVDVRAATALSNAPEGYTGYDGLSNEQIEELIKKRFATETLPGALAILHPEAAPVEGMEVTYSITFTAYTGASNEETAVYVVTAPGTFSYQSCTWWGNGEDADWN